MNNRDIPPELGNIIFISIPEEMETRLGDFTIDPAILLPVELPAGEQDLYLENLSWEMIIAAMLKILAYQPDHRHADYYRSFILAVKPSIVEELIMTGILKAKQRNYSLAEELFLALIHLEPENAAAWINLALVYEERADTYDKLEKEELAEDYRHKTISTYEKIFDLQPDIPEAHLNAGYFFLKIEGFHKAESHLRSFLELSGDRKKNDEVRKIVESLDEQNSLDSLFKEAFDYIRLGKEEEGIDRIRKFINKSPDVPNAWFLLGWAFRRLGKYSEGKDAFLKALELENPHTDILNELAICLMELGEFKESKKQLHKALRLEPENVKVISNLGILALKEKNTDEALGFFRTVLEIAPEDKIAQQYLDYLTSQ